MTPFIAGLSQRGADLTGLRVVWVRHAGGAVAHVVDPSIPGSGRAMLDGLARAGATITCLEGDTDLLLQGLARSWGWPWEAGAAGADRSPDPLPARPHHMRLLSAASIYAALGMARELEADVGRLVAVREDRQTPAARRVAAAELAVAGLRDRGLYAKAERAARVTAALDGVDPVRGRHLRLDAAWLRGRHLAAAWHVAQGVRLLRARRRPSGPKAGGTDGAGVELLIASLHWARDLRRLPGAGRLVPVALAGLLGRELLREARGWAWDARAAEGLRRLRGELSEVGVDLPVPAGMEARANEHVAAFAETDSLIGVVNAERARLRRLQRSGGEVDADARALMARCRVIGDRPGELKAALLLSSPSWGEVRHALRSWHRTEWTAARRLWWVGRLAWRLAARARRVGCAPSPERPPGLP